MSDQYVGEIRVVGFTFAPQGWLTCDGSLYAISEYEVLYSLLGTTYGGDGVNTFGVPDFRSRVPVGAGSGPGLSPYAVGQQAGAEQVALNANTTAPHNHVFMAYSGASDASDPKSALPAATPSALPRYSDQQPTDLLSNIAIATSGGSQGHDNIQPCLAQNIIIAFEGVFPSTG